MSVEQAIDCWFDGAKISRLGDGHIHDTFLAQVQDQHWVLQRVNQTVFVDPELVMAQTQRLLVHWAKQAVYQVPQLVAAKDGQLGQWVQGEYWRVWEYLPNTRVVDPINSSDQARAASFAFASLQASMASLAGEKFTDPIAGFLQLDFYLEAYDEVASAAPPELHRLVQDHAGLAEQFSERNAYVHGDCKVNNLLFDKTAEQVVAVIDFDTAMWGHWAWDLGDLMRSVSFSRQQVLVEDFSACLEGFVKLQPLCTVAQSIAAPAYIALTLAVRFLTDHLMGDEYFRVKTHGENLHRAQQQFDLFVELQAKQPEMQQAADQLFTALR